MDRTRLKLTLFWPLMLAVLFLLWIDKCTGNEDDKIYVRFECPSPDKKFIASFYRIEDDTMWGEHDGAVSVRLSDKPLRANSSIVRWDEAEEANLIWTESRHLLVQYTDSKDMLLKHKESKQDLSDKWHPEAGTITISYETIPSKDGKFIDRSKNVGCGYSKINTPLSPDIAHKPER